MLIHYFITLNQSLKYLLTFVLKSCCSTGLLSSIRVRAAQPDMLLHCFTLKCLGYLATFLSLFMFYYLPAQVFL